MALLDLLGRRGALRVLWELRGGAPQRFRALQDASELSPSVLNTRLTELREAGCVALTEAGYALTTNGLDLVESLSPLHAWAQAWAERTHR